MYKLKQCSIFSLDIELKPVNNKQSGLFVKGALDIVVKSLWWIVRRDIFHSLSTVSHYEELEYKQRFLQLYSATNGFKKTTRKRSLRRFAERIAGGRPSQQMIWHSFLGPRGPAVDGGVFVYAEGKQWDAYWI